MPPPPRASRLARSLTTRPVPWLLGALAVTVALGLQIRGLRLDSDYAALMADDWPLRLELEAARDRLGAGDDVVLALEGAPEARAAVAGDLAAELEQLPELAWVHDSRAGEFFADRALWLVPLGTLRELTAAIEHAHRELVRRALAVLPPEPGDPDPWAPLAALADRTRPELPAFDSAARDTTAETTYLFARPRLGTTAAAARARVLAAIERAVEAARPSERGVVVRLGGKLPVLVDEQRTLERDVRRATELALVIVIALLVGATRRLAAPLIVGLPLVASLAATLALARLVFGQLNVLSGFLLPALIGLGVDFGIHLYSRYLDELADGAGRAAAMTAAIDETFGGCLTSAATTAAAFAALMVTDLRGFREVGALAAAGISLMFAITYAMLPPLAMLLTRRGRPRAARPAPRLGRTLAVAVVACFAVAALLALPHLRDLRFHNDFRRFKASSPELAITDALERRAGIALSPAAFIVRDAHEAALLQRELRALPGVRATLSVADLVPADRDERARLHATLERLLTKLVALAPEEERGVHELERLLELARAAPWARGELPPQALRRLVLDDGDLVVLAFPARSLYDQDELAAWVASLDTALRRLRVEGIDATALDERRVTVAVLGQIEAEMPTAVALAALAVLLLVLGRFRRPAAFAPIVVVVGLAVPMLLGLLAALGEPLHVYSIIALPAIIGVGVDNAIHLQHAHLRRGPGSIPVVLATTGRAAVLASATTAAGFGIDVIATHPGVRSLGWVAAAGIAGMLIATTAVLPALLHLLDARALRARGPRVGRK